MQASSLIGPRSISKVNQVAIPVDFMRMLGLAPGDQVYFEATDGPEPELRIVPARTVERRYADGRAAAKLGAARTGTERGDTAS